MIKGSKQNINSKLKEVEEKFTGIYNKLREEVEDIMEEVSDLKTQVDDVKTQADGVERRMSDEIRTQYYKTFFMLISAEHKTCPASKCKNCQPLLPF